MGDEAEVWKGFGCTKPHFLRKQRGKNTPGERAVLLCAPAEPPRRKTPTATGLHPGLRCPRTSAKPSGSVTVPVCWGMVCKDSKVLVEPLALVY